VRARGLTALGALMCLVLAACMSAVPQRAPEVVHREIARILAQPAYRQAQPSWVREKLVELIQWLRSFLGGWWSDAAFELRETWPGLYWAIVVALTALVAALLYHVWLTITAAMRRDEAPRGAGPRPESTDPDVLKTEAETLAAEGRYREAVSRLQVALLRTLDREGVIRYDPSRTNWEYLAAVRGMPSLADVFESLTLRLDDVLYGGVAIDRPGYEACARLVTQAAAAARVTP